MSIPPVRRLLLAALALGAAALVALSFAAPALIGGRLREASRQRGMVSTWRSLRYFPPATVTFADLVVESSAHDTLLDARRLMVTLDAHALLALRARVERVQVEHATLHLSGSADSSEWKDDAADRAQRSSDAHERILRMADALAEAAVAPARDLPSVELRDVRIARGDADLRFEHLDFERVADAITASARGSLTRERAVPFEGTMRWGFDDRLACTATFGLPDPATARAAPLRIRMSGRASQQPGRSLTLAPGSAFHVGALSLLAEGRIDRVGPRFDAALRADGLTAGRIRASIPAALLGPLTDLDVRGTWDWVARAHVDLARLDSTRLTAAVTPHGMSLAPTRLGGAMLALDEPFVAMIHLPRDRIEARELSDANPFYRPLDAIAPQLVSALITNEDGGFLNHRGFNAEAMRQAIGANLREGRYKRGAGTITMQLARNLWLGHRRTLGRKGQEVVMAWILEHLSGVSKARMLEIYLNIIEWGPGVHGAAEAARYYFDKDPSALTLDESLFLTILVPSPARWRGRVDAGGALRSGARQQMAFIARKMADKGWLEPGDVPQAESLHVELRGAARDVIWPPAPAPAPPDSVAATI